MRDFRKLNVWQDGINLAKETYRLSDLLPAEEKFGLKSQICRASVSVPSNIAEGCSRNSQFEFKRFLEIAMGSAFEMETQFIIIKELNLIKEEKLATIFDMLNKEQRSINNLINRIKETDR
jgi:four helix bundle protein